MLEAFEEWKNTKSRHKDFPDEDAYLYGAEDAWRECLRFVKNLDKTCEFYPADAINFWNIINKELGEQ